MLEKSDVAQSWPITALQPSVHLRGVQRSAPHQAMWAERLAATGLLSEFKTGRTHYATGKDESSDHKDCSTFQL